MISQLLLRKKRCAERREEEEEELKNNKMEKMIKECSSSMMQHENKSASSTTWSDLDSDMLREIDKKLCYGDHIRFRGVCKSWRAAGREKREADVLPWFMWLCLDLRRWRLVYKLYETPSLYPFKSETTASTIISGSIDLRHFDDKSNGDRMPMSTDFTYVDHGWVYISVYDCKSNSSNFLFFSLATKASFTLPQLNVSTRPICLGLSTTPDSPDCVFLALNVIDDQTRTIGIFRHGDTHWTTTTQSDGGSFGHPRYHDVVFIRGVFYFLMTNGIGSYDLATGFLKVDPFSAVIEFYDIQHFFGLDGDLILAYIEKETRNLCVRKYDWLNKVWVPLQSLGGRSLYLSGHAVYIDQINYYGISSANKIYFKGIKNETYSWVDEYTLEDGRLSKSCPSARWWGSYRPSVRWICPPDVLLRK